MKIEKKKSEKSHEKMDALMKTWQIGILAWKFESREKNFIQKWKLGK